MILLVGVDHLVQHKNSNYCEADLNTVTAFADCLKETAINHNVVLIAEEFNADAFAPGDEPISTACGVANELGIEHRFCDPTRAERVEHNIKTPRDREHFWLEKVRVNQQDAVLFICGDDHLDTFPEELHSASFEVSIASRGWGC